MHLYKFERILVCTDFSHSSDQALKTAEQLRQRSDCQVDLIHISELGFQLDENLTEGSSYRAIILGEIRKTVENKIADQLKRCQAQANPIIKDGNVVQVITEMAEKSSYDLIIMGHGRSPLMSQILGSTAYKMISSSPLPLLLVKSPMKFGKMFGLIDESRERDKIIIGTFDFFSKFKFNEIGFISLLIDFPPPFGVKSINESKEKLEKEIKHFTPSNINPEIIIEATRELKLAIPLNQKLHEHKAELAVLKKFSDGNLKRVYLGSTSKKILENFEGNILIIPPSSIND